MSTDVQLDLLAMARTGDPDTSRDAALSMVDALRPQQALVLDAVTRFHSMHHRGTTAYEVATLVDPRHELQQSVAARRCTDLRDAGLIRDSGLRRPGRSGRQLIAWVPTVVESPP